MEEKTRSHPGIEPLTRQLLIVAASRSGLTDLFSVVLVHGSPRRDGNLGRMKKRDPLERGAPYLAEA